MYPHCRARGRNRRAAPGHAPGRGRGRRTLLAAGFGLAVLVAGTACGDGGGDAGSAGTATAATTAPRSTGAAAGGTGDAPPTGRATGTATTAAAEAPASSGRPPDDAGNHAATHSLTFIAIGDGGASGAPIGCGDSAVPVDVGTSTIAPLGEVYRAQLAVGGTEYGRSGLYNALAQSDLQYASAAIDGGHVTVRLTGDLRMGGECDIPRVRAQLTEPALQFPDVDSVTVMIDGVPLDQKLSLR